MQRPELGAVLELMKPITWFAPMWAFGCGVVSSGLAPSTRWAVAIAGLAVAGPLVCATSQAVNDWFDRHVDAINEPGRPIPSGRIPGRWALYIACLWSAISLGVAVTLGVWVFVAALVALGFAWAYSAPPLRLKRNGWWGNSAFAICYEGVPWFTGAAAMAAGLPDLRVVVLALLYSVGAHGIMTLNDFKSVEGDKRSGVRSLPVQLGVDRAGKVACVAMAVPQIVVAAILLYWGRPIHTALIAALLLGQFALMRNLVARPREQAAFYNATGTTLYVIGMLVSAFALRNA